MLDGATGLFGQEEWSDVQGTDGVSFFLSAAPCSPAVVASWLAFATTHKYQPPIFAWLYLWPSFLPCSYFYKAGGVILGCIKISEHTCWSTNVQTRRGVINQQLLILRKQSSPPPGLICFAPIDSFTPEKT